MKPGFFVGKILKNTGISSRITFFYCILLIITITISGLLYQKIYAGIMLKKVSSVSMQTLQSINSNVQSLFQLVNNYSMMFLPNHDVRDLLKSAEGYSNLELNRRVDNFIKMMMSSFTEISSIYLVDNEGHQFYTDNFAKELQSLNTDPGSRWWTRAAELRGSSFMVLNGDDAFSHIQPRNFISNIRVVNNIEDQKPIGAVIINVSETLFIQAYSEIAKNYETRIILLDENNNNIIRDVETADIHIDELLANAGDEDSHFMYFNEDKQLYSYLKIEDYNWKIISIIPYGEVAKESKIFILITSVVLLFIAIIIILSSIALSRLISRPINILVASMKDMGTGNFNKVNIDTTIVEYIRLRDGYNMMVDEIHSLLKSVVEKEEFKRKAEMNILQAQIKPHFLYNTFDSVNSLALMGRNDDVHKMMTALGSYYRTSLSKGKEIITIREEIEMIRNYLEIQKYRYGDILTVIYDTDKRIEKIRILKLILQPFVENALYHGIKPKGESGEIHVKTWQDDKAIKLMIKDDGVGMSGRELSELLQTMETKDHSAGFGTAGTVQRLKFFYDCDDIFTIKSKKGAGTEVILTIPLSKVNLYER